jgi:unsaturated rhamnogalacturonyl hydrolase
MFRPGALTAFYHGRKGWFIMEGANSLQALANRVLSKIQQPSTEWNLDMNRWDWNPGVTLYGIVRYYEVTRDHAFLAFIRNWLERNASCRNFGSVNYVAPTHAAEFMLKQTGESGWKGLCEEYVRWCLEEAVFTTNGGFAHVWGKGGLDDYKNQLWIDTLFMAGLFMIRYGLNADLPELVRAGFKQFDIHIDSQFDENSGLFYHGYHCLTKMRLGERWGRGNGWAAVSLAEVLEQTRDQGYETKRYKDVFCALMNQAYSLRSDNGMLRTLLLDEEAYPESTATLLFGIAACIGRRIGILDQRFAEWVGQVHELLFALVDGDGALRYASGGTDCQERDGYLQVPYAVTQYGQGLVLMFIAEFNRIEKESPDHDGTL